MKDKLKVTIDPKDGHKVITHSRPLSKQQQARAKYRKLVPEAEQIRKRRTNYWSRHKDMFNMPVVFYLTIVLLAIVLIILSIVA